MKTPALRPYAGPVSRAIAYLLDILVVAVLVTGGAAVVDLIARFLGARWHELAGAVTSAFLVALPALLAAYCALFWALAGRTPGMAMLGLRVVAIRSERLSWPAALLRALVLAYFPIGATWALVDRRRQAVHDKVAGTAVVRAPSSRRPPSVAP
ncbi:MAG TPA: RDD family protein [Actinoplanes sp.]